MLLSETQSMTQPEGQLATPPFVSVIIPVYNDAVRLQRCLQALEQQIYPSDRYEVIVVDNGSTNCVEIAAIAAQFKHAIVALETVPGSYVARNRGIALASGEILAFTDADCIPAANWLKQGVKHLCQSPNQGLVAGRVEIFFEDGQPVTAVALYEKVTAFPQEQLLTRLKGGATANVFTFKSVMERVGCFNPNLKARGDLEWGKRVYAAGYQQTYADDVWVAHPARSSYAELYQRSRRLVGGIYDTQQAQNSSFLQQNLFFVKELLKNLVPPLFFVWNTLFDQRLETIAQKLKVAGVMLLVRYISAFELLRLKLGGQSIRV